MTAGSRMGKLFKRAEEGPEDDDADLGEDEHAWWARREGVHAVPRGTTGDDDEPEHDPRFSDYWTPESLFDEPPPAPGPGDGAEMAADEDDHGMDLDAAHLVLQVAFGADWDEVTAAHRRLAKLYHPDRLVEHSAEAQELGRQRMAEINAAHGALRRVHFH